ncbi:MAG: hypothetical protein QF473_01575 [Planctomycetota bacterium]|nr:hypothetical protein [Planctomycetota bacterium]MDP6502307.1 hypothetical protein [Planctomycetota bacterium]
MIGVYAFCKWWRSSRTVSIIELIQQISKVVETFARLIIIRFDKHADRVIKIISIEDIIELSAATVYYDDIIPVLSIEVTIIKIFDEGLYNLIRRDPRVFTKLGEPSKNSSVCSRIRTPLLLPRKGLQAHP